ncbi:MAG: hypothetical protein M1495_08740 [Bacteroidetes bacterium]|nr:hypothetical protein [Bacteroidota bacterium]
MINYDEIEKLLIETLEKETPESLRHWLDKKKKEERLANLGEGEYQYLDVESASFCHEPNSTNAETPTINAGEYYYFVAA